MHYLIVEKYIKNTFMRRKFLAFFSDWSHGESYFVCYRDLLGDLLILQNKNRFRPPPEDMFYKDSKF